MTPLEELERATEGSLEIDGKIAEAVGWCFVPAHTLSKAKWLPPDWSDPATDDCFLEPPAFSRSLDAARTLVSDNAAWWEIRKMSSATSPMRGRGMFHARVGNSWGEQGYLVQHNNPALALCAAALKAREHEKAKDSVTSS